MKPEDLVQMRNMVESSWTPSEPTEDEVASAMVSDYLGDLWDVMWDHFKTAPEKLAKKLNITEKKAEALLQHALSGEKVRVHVFGRKYEIEFW